MKIIRVNLKALLIMLAVMALAVVSAGTMITAQEKAKEPTPKAQKEGPKDAKIEAESWATTWSSDKKNKKVHFKGNVRVTHEDTLLTSNAIDYDDTAKIAVSPAKFDITNPDCDITGDKGTAYLRKRLGVVEGNVVMLLKLKKTETEKADKDSIRGKLKEQTTVTCPNLEYQYREKIATATGGVTFKQTNRTASADSAVYNAKTEILVLTGNVKGTDEFKQTFAAPRVEISLKEGDEWLKAENATALFKIDLDEETDDETPSE